MNKELEFCEEWLLLRKYYFKILTVITVLADNKKAFRGQLKDLCECLHIQPSSVNLQKMIEAIKFLEENDYMKVIIDKDIYTLSLSKSAEKSKKIIKIKKTWYNLIRENHEGTSWENTLKVFLVIIELSSNEVIKYSDISARTNISCRTIQNCVKAICNIDFGDFMISREKHTHKNEDNTYTGEGQSFVKGLTFE